MNNILLSPKKIFLGLTIAAVFVSPQLTLAANSVANNTALLGKSSKLSGGIDSDKLSKCLYNPDQTSFKDVLVNPENPNLLNSDLTDELKSKDYCKQVLAIYGITHYLPAPQSLKKYHNVNVYYTYTDGTMKKTYFMIDNKGQVLQLTKEMTLSASDGYLQLNNKYPTKVTETPTLTAYASKYPISSNLPNEASRLVFSQDITLGNCVTCKKIGEANIAYDFDKKGYYLQSEVVSVHAK
jgi:hypothetical protein